MLTRPIEIRGLLHELIVETCRIGPLLDFQPIHVHVAEMIRHELTAAQSTPVQLSLPTELTAARLARLVIEDPGLANNVDLLCRTVGSSRRTMERKFSAETGISLGRWIQQARLLLSTQHLHQRNSMLEVAIAAGYSSSSAYINAFRRQFGVAPARWS